MSNFYGKRFLSSLLGALSVLGSPVASAVGGKLGKGNLKGKVGSSAGRSKNGGKGGDLEADRKVKSVNGLKKVLKETGGKVVRVSPDGKGGFVAFVKTPTGKVVTVAVVGVSLLAIITFLVFNGRKNDGGYIDESSEGENPKFVVNKASGGLLASLFNNDQDRYNLFVGRLLNGFFYDAKGVLGRRFYECNADLDGFLKVVFEGSTFINWGAWKVDGVFGNAVVSWGSSNSLLTVVRFDSKRIEPLKSVLGYLSKSPFVDLQGGRQASWGDKISAILFGYWCFVEFGLDVESDAEKVKSRLNGQNVSRLSNTFKIIKSYVGECLKDANRDYDGKKSEPVG